MRYHKAWLQQCRFIFSHMLEAHKQETIRLCPWLAASCPWAAHDLSSVVTQTPGVSTTQSQQRKNFVTLVKNSAWTRADHWVWSLQEIQGCLAGKAGRGYLISAWWWRCPAELSVGSATLPACLVYRMLCFTDPSESQSLVSLGHRPAHAITFSTWAPTDVLAQCPLATQPPPDALRKAFFPLATSWQQNQSICWEPLGLF